MVKAGISVRCRKLRETETVTVRHIRQHSGNEDRNTARERDREWDRKRVRLTARQGTQR